MATAPTRRGFLEGALATAFLGLAPAQRLPIPAAGGGPDDEAFWEQLRRDQFLLPAWRAYLNNGSLGVCPRAVVAATVASVGEAARREHRGEYPRWGYEQIPELRDKVARFAGTVRDRLAITHNATHAMYLVAGGLQLEPGDEVLLTDQEHPTCNGSWDQEAARQGIKVRRVKIPIAPSDPAAITGAVMSAVRPRTRVMVFSEILTTTGGRLPAAELCAAGREAGLITVVDGAHCPGQVPLAIDRLGCDAYCASPHKWLLAPAGNGFLVLSERLMDRLWCANGAHWWDQRHLKAARFMGLGTSNSSVHAGLEAALDWYEEVGAERIHARQHALARRVLERARRLPAVDLATADDDRQFQAMVSFGVAGIDLAACDRRHAEAGLWTTRVGDRWRVSCHVHVRPRDLDLFFGIIEDQARRQGL